MCAAISQGEPAAAIMKVGYLKNSDNPYSGKLVLLDEAHNLLEPENERLTRLRWCLRCAEDLILVAFTATPIRHDPRDGQRVLDIIKGAAGPSSNDGFIKSLVTRPKALYPHMVPAGIEDGSIFTEVQRPNLSKDLVQKVRLEGRALKIYLAKKTLHVDGPRLQTYCSTPVTRLHAATRAKVLSSKKQFAPKLFAIAETISHISGKCLVMVDRGSYELMAAILQDVGKDSRAPFRIATTEHLSESNHSSNARGETHRVFLGDSRD